MKYIILGHENPDVDSVLSGILLEQIKNSKNDGNKYKFIIPDKEIDDITVRIVTDLGYDLNDYRYNQIDKDAEIILVDHYEDNRFPNRIVEVYDHHPVLNDNDVSTGKKYINRNSCSTTTILMQEYPNDITIDQFIQVLVAALVDTTSFTSDKTVQEEKEFFERKCRQLNINIDYYKEIGLCLNDLNKLDKDCYYGLKTYTINNKTVEASYIQIKDVECNQEKINYMLFLLNKHRIENGIYMSVFIVHDMDVFKSKVYKITDEGTTTKEYDHYASRGKTIMTDIKEEMSAKKRTLY